MESEGRPKKSLHHKSRNFTFMHVNSRWWRQQRICLVLYLVPKTFTLTCTVLTFFSHKCHHSYLFSNATEGRLQRMISDDLNVIWTYFFPKSLEWNHSIKSSMASPIPDVPIWRSQLQLKTFLRTKNTCPSQNTVSHQPITIGHLQYVIVQT